MKKTLHYSMLNLKQHQEKIDKLSKTVTQIQSLDNDNISSYKDQDEKLSNIQVYRIIMWLFLDILLLSTGSLFYEQDNKFLGFLFICSAAAVTIVLLIKLIRKCSNKKSNSRTCDNQYQKQSYQPNITPGIDESKVQASSYSKKQQEKHAYRRKKYSEINRDLKSTSDLMRSAIKKALIREAKLKELNDKAERIGDNAFSFHQSSKKLSRKSNREIIILAFLDIALLAIGGWLVNQDGQTSQILGFFFICIAVAVTIVWLLTNSIKKCSARKSNHRIYDRQYQRPHQPNISLLRDENDEKEYSPSSENHPTIFSNLNKSPLVELENHPIISSNLNKSPSVEKEIKSFGQKVLEELNFKIPPTDQKKTMQGLKTSILNSTTGKDVLAALKIAYWKLESSSLFGGGRALNYVKMTLIPLAEKKYSEKSSSLSIFETQNKNDQEFYFYTKFDRFDLC